MAVKPNNEEVNFDSFMKLPVWMFRLCFFHFDPLSENATFIQKAKHFAMENYFRFILICMCCSMTMFAMFGVVNFQTNFVGSLSSVPNSNCILLILLKGFYTFRHRVEIWNIWQQLKVLVNQRVTEIGRYNMKPYLDEYQFIIKVYGVPFVLAVLPISYPIIPYILFGRMELVIKYWYPINIFQIAVFPFAWTWVNFVAYNACFLLICADSLLYALTSVILMEFDRLKKDLDNLKETKNNKVLLMKLFAQRHNKLLDLVDKLQNIYGLTFLCSFVISALIICFIAFQLSVFEADYEAYAFNVPYLAMMGGQIFLLSLYGQKLIDTSVAVADGIYESGWEEIDEIEIKKCFIMIILRARKPARFTAMGFAEIDLGKFTSIMTTTGSYFTLLKNVYSGK